MASAPSICPVGGHTHPDRDRLHSNVVCAWCNVPLTFARTAPDLRTVIKRIRKKAELRERRPLDKLKHAHAMHARAVTRRKRAQTIERKWNAAIGRGLPT